MISVPCAKIYKNDKNYRIKKFEGKFINGGNNMHNKFIFTMMQ